MHGCSSGSGLLVNAEVDSMGGVVDGGVGIGLKTSPRRAAIERAQAELRQEYDVREERRRELEFLEKVWQFNLPRYLSSPVNDNPLIAPHFQGGNPLDFKFGNAASVSVQSTSLTDQHPEQIVTSEAKGSFALAASPHGDSVESSGRPGVPTVCEPNSADNLLLLDGNNELLEGERSSIHPRRRNNIAPSEQSSQMDGSQNAKESEDSAIVRPYARRNRSRPIREGARGRDGKGMASEANNIKDQNIPSVSNPKSARSNGDMVSKIATSNNQLESDLDGVRALETTGGSLPEGKLDVKVPKILRDNQHDQPSQVNAQQNAFDMASGRPDPVGEMNQVVSAGFEHPPRATATKAENETRPGQPNGFSNIKLDRKSINEGQNSNAVLGTKGLDSESSCTQASLGVDVNNDNDMCTNTRNVLSNGNTMEQTSDLEETINLAGGEVIKEKNESRDVDEKNETNAIEKRNQAMDVDSCSITNARDSVYQNHSGNGTIVKVEEDVNISRFEPQNEVKYPSNIEGVQQNEHIPSDTERKVEDVLGDNSNPSKENLCTGVLQESMDVFDCEIPGTALPGRDSCAAPEPQTCSGNHLKADKAHEDSILEEARIIEAKRKRIAELSVHTSYSENRRKSQWDFVLEEMAWLANDFAQERLWKINAAAQICHRVAFSSRLRFEQQNQCWEMKRVAHSLAKVVMQFWSSAEALLNSDDQTVVQKNCKYGLVGSRRIDGNEVSEDKIGESDMEMIKESGTQYPRKNPSVSVLGYAVRFLKYNSSLGPLQAEAPTTPDRISDVGIVEMSWEDHLTEESLLYSVPSGAMESYRKSIESHLLQFERTGSSMQEEVETSTYDAVAEYGYEENAYDEDEGETSTFCLPGAFEGSKSTKFAQKKRKHLMKSYTSRSFEVGADLHYGQCTTGTQQSMLMGKRPASLNVGSIPTKRMRTATRQRVLSPFGAGATGTIQAQVKTDASSGDTNSCQDDQSTLHGGLQIQKSVEVESAGDFEKQLPYDYAETSIKPKKKKKAKHLGSYDQGWQLDSAVNEQRDHSKKRLDSLHFESNGNSGLYGQPNAKKPKIMKQSLDNTFDNITPMSGSIPSPVASQMSNMSNPNKFIKLIGGRDRGRKAKVLKMSAGQPGSGSPWSLFEDQALVVLVHDMGPNWELVSDVINSTLQFKCIFRKPKECKERHKFLMDRSAGDGADSAEDSGSSQSYPSTLPGIPKGSARQLFQRLQGPMEEDTIKAHFEKIILIGQKQHYLRSQNDNQDPKQVAAVHNSHVVALSQVCPNNLNGGFLTPLDLCDATTSCQDVPLNYQGSHTSGLAISSQGAAATILPASGPNSALQGSSSMVLGSNLSSPSGPLTSGRDVRYNVPRSSLPVDEQQRMQQYNQMLSGRNIQQPSMSVPGALSGADRGVRMLPGGNGMGMMCGMSRGMPISRPGFQGMASSPMLNSGSMLSSSMVGMPSPVNMHSGAGPGQVNSILRPREALHMIRPGHNPEHQRQMMVPELQMQVTQGNSQVIPPFNGLSSAFSNQTSPPVQPYAGHSQQQHQMSPQQSHALGSPHHPHIQGPNHATGPQHTAYAIRMAKERQLQHRYMQQQQQQQFAASNALMPHVPPQPQLPISSSLQNSSQIQPQTSSQSVSVSPVAPPSPVTPLSSQHQQKHHLPQHGLSRNPGASGLTNQMGKQRQRQPQQQQFQQSGRHHPQQRQQAQAQQQAKLLKGIGRGNMLVHQNLSIDTSHLNGLSMPPGSQAPEKGEQIMHLMQGQGLYSGSGLNPVQPSKPQVPSQSSNHPQLQQKLLSGSVPPSSKQLQQMPSHSDSSTQGQAPLVPSGHTLSASHQAGPSAVVASNHHQQLQPQPQPHQKQVNQSQSSVQRMLQQNRQVNSELQNKSQTDISQADQQAVTSVSQVSSSTVMPQGCIDSANVVPIVSSAIAAQWKESEPTYDSNLPNSAAQVGSIGGLPVSSSAGSEPLPPISQGLGARQLSGSLPSHGLNVGAQWQPQLPLQQSPTAPPPSQQQYQPQEQQQEQQSPQHHLLPLQSQQQTQLLQAGQGSLYMRPTNSKLE